MHLKLSIPMKTKNWVICVFHILKIFNFNLPVVLLVSVALAMCSSLACFIVLSCAFSYMYGDV